MSYRSKEAGLCGQPFCYIKNYKYIVTSAFLVFTPQLSGELDVTGGIDPDVVREYHEVEVGAG